MSYRKQIRGISFPFRINVRGGIAMSVTNTNTFTHTDEAIHQLLTTERGERLMEFYLYSDLDTLIFEPNDETTKSLLEFEVKDTIQTHLSDTLEIDNIEVSQTKNLIFADITYHLINFGGNLHTTRVQIGGYE